MNPWTRKIFFLLLIFALGFFLSCGDDDDPSTGSGQAIDGDDDDAADDDAADDDASDDDATDDDDLPPYEYKPFMPLNFEWNDGYLLMRPSYGLYENMRYVLVAARGLTPKGGACYKASNSMREVWAAYAGTTAEAYAEPCADGPEFTFDLASTPMVVPFPNDLYTVADETSPTGRRVLIDGDTAAPMGRLAGIGALGFVWKPMNELSGFSTQAQLYLPVGQEPAAASLPDAYDPGIADAIFLMADVDGADNEKSEIDRYESVLAHLEELGLAADQILSISDFTTLWATKDLDDARQILDQMAQSDPPEIVDWDITPHSSGSLQGYAYATLPTPIFQNKNGRWARDASGNLKVQQWEDVEVLITLPAADATEKGQPYPLIVYGHGVGDIKESVIQSPLASVLASNGFAFAALDAVCHGNRAWLDTEDPYLLSMAAMLCYFRFLDPLVFRDNLQETIANKMWLTRALKQLGDIDVIPEGGDGIPDFDTEHIYYLSISMGSIHGGTLSALDKNIDAYVFSSAGAKFTGIAIEGPYLGQFVDIAELIDMIVPGLATEELLWTVGLAFQNALDAADPANFLLYTNQNPVLGLDGYRPPVFQQGSSDDFMLGGLSGAYFNRAGGWPQLEPYVWDVEYVEHDSCPHQGSGFYQYDTDEHFYLWMTGSMGTAYRDQAAHFLRTHYETGIAEIIDPLAE